MTIPNIESNVQLIPSQEKRDNSKLPLLIYDPEIARAWKQKPQNILIYRGQTLASIRPEELANLQEESILLV